MAEFFSGSASQVEEEPVVWGAEGRKDQLEAQMKSGNADFEHELQLLAGHH